MTSESEFLLATLRGQGTPAPPSINWEVLLDLAESHGVLPLFCRNFSGELPTTFVGHLQTQWARSAFLATELEGLLRPFGLHGIEVLALKGPVMGETLYGRMGLRPCDDLDLLVQPQDLARAQTLLIDLGFTPFQEMDDYHQPFGRGNTFVELHSAVAPPSSPGMDLEGAWRRAPVLQFRGQRLRFFAKPDLLIYLTIHGIKHEFARLIWVLDAVHALADLDDGDLAQALQMARSLGMEGAFLTTCELARLGFNLTLPAPVAETIARKPVIATRAGAMWEKIVAGPAVPGTSHQGAGVFVQMEPDARSRWTRRLRFFTPTAKDLQWAERHNINPRWMFLLRPFRLLSKHGPATAWRTLFPRFIF
jgi:Uncharacterised nucleotidyltransferase